MLEGISSTPVMNSRSETGSELPSLDVGRRWGVLASPVQQESLLLVKNNVKPKTYGT
jgi:hypothetical protein